MESFIDDLVSALREFVLDSSWQCVGKVSDFAGKKCTLLYASQEDPEILNDNVALFCLPATDSQVSFFAIDSSSPHEGGPLHAGDIEDIGGHPTVYCPWHSYEFNLKTGKSETGLQTQPYDVEVADGKVYIKINRSLSKDAPSGDHAYSMPVTSPGKNKGISHEPRDTLCDWACKILKTAKPREKVKLTELVHKHWTEGNLCVIGEAIPPKQPARIEDLTVVAPGKIRRGKGGTLNSRIAMLHSLANIEQWAIDLSWDIIARFANTEVNGEKLPREFFSDFIKVAADEAKHFRLLEERLLLFGSRFGALPVHNGLWQSAEQTCDSLLARLAIVHMVHEARGLDVHPQTSSRFEAQGDKQSVSVMEVIYQDEITHVAAGIKWFLYMCNASKPPLDPIPTFHSIVKKHFRGYLKPPFNTEGRKTAGMLPEWYEPLMTPNQV